ncbi:hypothetical protein ACQ4PT_058328 [Festuca glaucescens]
MLSGAWHRRRGLADLPPLARSEPVRPRKLPPRAKQRRDWTNLAADIVRDVAARLLIPDSPRPAVGEFNRLRAVCKTWREYIDDCSLDTRFRPRGWTPVRDPPPMSGCRLRHISRVRAYVELDALSTNYLFGVADGLLVVRDKHRADVVRLLNPLTGMLTEFPPITEVRAYDGSEPESGLIDALKLYFSNPRATVFRYCAAIDDSTSPPSLVLCVSDNSHCYQLVLSASPFLGTLSCDDTKLYWLVSQATPAVRGICADDGVDLEGAPGSTRPSGMENSSATTHGLVPHQAALKAEGMGACGGERLGRRCNGRAAAHDRHAQQARQEEEEQAAGDGKASNGLWRKRLAMFQQGILGKVYCYSHLSPFVTS